MSKAAGRLMIAFGIICLMVSLGIYLRQDYAMRIYAIQNEERLNMMEEKMENISPFQTTISLEEENYSGYLEIPSLELVLPVLADWNEEDMYTAPCQYYGMAADNDLVVAAHNASHLFGGLKKLNVGDTIVFTTVQKESITYKVEMIEVLQSHQVEEMINSDYDLTLYTCTSNGMDRLTLRCNRMR